MVLSIVAMGFAAIGLLPAAAGALLQEAIDVAVILNALRALRAGADEAPALTAETQGLLRRFSAEHTVMRDDLFLLRSTAQQLATGERVPAMASLRRSDAFVQDVLLPHEHAEDSSLYPALARPLGSAEATVTMSRMHAEIERSAQRLHAHFVSAEAAGAISDAQTEDLLACLYGLDALLSLHFITEEENYFALLREGVGDS
jgi:iron-sulfur cluster repair protein YtfE (RIC family)